MSAKGVLITSLLLLLTGCGFHLQQHSLLPAPLHTLALQTPHQYSAIATMLANHLKSSGVTLVTKKKAPYRLEILSEETQQLVNKISANTQVRHFTLIDTIALQLTDQHGHFILKPTTLRAQTHYAVNTQQILGLNSLLAQAERSLHQDIARQLLFRLKAQDVLDNLTKNKPIS